MKTLNSIIVITIFLYSCEPASHAPSACDVKIDSLKNELQILHEQWRVQDHMRRVQATGLHSLTKELERKKKVLRKMQEDSKK